jgi:hypothetical protein
MKAPATFEAPMSHALNIHCSAPFTPSVAFTYLVSCNDLLELALVCQHLLPGCLRCRKWRGLLVQAVQLSTQGTHRLQGQQERKCRAGIAQCGTAVGTAHG